jgi:hypothetical protein
MVRSSALAITTDIECLTCNGFSLGETFCFGSLEFMADCFGGLSLSPKGSDPGAIIMGTTHSGSPSLRAMIEDSTIEFYMTSSREGSSSLPASLRHSMGAPHNPIATIPKLEDTPATQTMTIVQPWRLALQSHTGLPLK